MKIKNLYEKLTEIAEQLGVKVRKDTLVRSRGGYCLLNDDKVIILNKRLPIEAQSSVLARCLYEIDNFNQLEIDAKLLAYIQHEISNKKTDSIVEFIIDE